MFRLAWVAFLPHAGAVPFGPAVSIFNDFPGLDWSVPVWTYRPHSADADTPVVFVCHGLDRNGRSYRNAWQDHAQRLGFLLVVAEFTEASFPGSRSYNQGNLVDSQGNPKPPTDWSFQVIERVFDDVVAKTASTRTRYHIFGHSAGAQFVHRMLLLMPDARIERAVFANAGWYTVPDPTVDYPYGLRNSPFQKHIVNSRLRENHLILLGTEDNDPNDPNLNRGALTDVQGTHRFDRGHYFFDKARQYAAIEGIQLGLSLGFAPGVGHSNSAIAPYAANWLIHPVQGVGLVLYSITATRLTLDFNRGLPSPARTGSQWIDNYIFPGLSITATHQGTPQSYRIHETSADGRFQHWRANASSVNGFFGGRPNAITGDFHYQLRLTNNSGQTLNRVSIAYTLRQFHLAVTPDPARMQVSLATAASNQTAPESWAQVPQLTLRAPLTGDGIGPAVSTDPYADASVVDSGVRLVGNLSWHPGENLWIRWTNPATTTAGHGLGIDQVRISAFPAEVISGTEPVQLALQVITDGSGRIIHLVTSPSNDGGLLQQSANLVDWEDLIQVLPVVSDGNLHWQFSDLHSAQFFRYLHTRSQSVTVETHYNY